MLRARLTRDDKQTHTKNKNKTKKHPTSPLKQIKAIVHPFVSYLELNALLNQASVYSTPREVNTNMTGSQEQNTRICFLCIHW